MTDQIVTWRLNSATKQVEIMQGSRVLEVTTLAQTPARLSFHRAEVWARPTARRSSKLAHVGGQRNGKRKHCPGREPSDRRPGPS